ncbi:MAG: hypothetical protein JW880_02580 [Candidatus Thermoplasmatota archaeon]|nr:hypothetical protein [Candidatus Thermoplasmatota archaeon]
MTTVVATCSWCALLAVLAASIILRDGLHIVTAAHAFPAYAVATLIPNWFMSYVQIITSNLKPLGLQPSTSSTNPPRSVLLASAQALLPRP